MSQTEAKPNPKFFLTGGPGNTNPYASIGGFVSNTEVASSGFNTLFGDITTSAAIAGDVTYRCVGLANTAALTGPANNFWDAQLWVEDDPNDWFDIALEVPIYSGYEGGLDVWPPQNPAQQIADEHEEPPGVTWTKTCNPFTLDGQGNDCSWLSIGTFQIPITMIYPPPRPNRIGSTLPGGMMQYFWIRRTIPPGTPPTAGYTFTIRSVGVTQVTTG